MCVIDNSNTPLHVACAGGNLEVIKYLVTEQKCNPSCTNIDGAIPLFHACQLGHIDIVSYLVTECKCDPGKKQSSKYKTLHRSSFGYNSKFLFTDVPIISQEDQKHPFRNCCQRFYSPTCSRFERASTNCKVPYHWMWLQSKHFWQLRIHTTWLCPYWETSWNSSAPHDWIQMQVSNLYKALLWCPSGAEWRVGLPGFSEAVPWLRCDSIAVGYPLGRLRNCQNFMQLPFTDQSWCDTIAIACILCMQIPWHCQLPQWWMWSWPTLFTCWWFDSIACYMHRPIVFGHECCGGL